LDGFALGLILASAVLHAWWNLLAKRVGGGATFIWLYATAAFVIYAPVVAVLAFTSRMELSAQGAVFVVGASCLHTLYLLLLQRGYRLGDLSVIYPLARGTGPTLSTAAAIWLLGERPPVAVLVGAGLVILGVVVLTRAPGGTRPVSTRAALTTGLACGVVIAAYTVCDKFTVAELGVSPFLLTQMSC
jgi:drug/metabolite transporter (DMT)-like permease